MSEACDQAWFDNIARLDWLYAGPSYKRLHAPVESTWDEDEWAAHDVTFACGWTAERAEIPGMFSRMGAPRCSRCCDEVGYPRGEGSPKNDQDCRRLLGLPVRGTPEYDAELAAMGARFAAISSGGGG